MGKRFTVKKINSIEEIQRLLENNNALKQNSDHSPEIDALIKAHSKTKVSPTRQPIASISDQVFSHGCNIAIIQNPVQDPDFFAEHHLYYSKQFQSTSQLCTRVHFFSHKNKTNENYDERDAIEVIDELFLEKSKYIGFATLRPIRFSPIGATIITPTQKKFITCRDKFEVHLAGRMFVVEGTPFMQQDNAVGACAQTAVWVALRTVRRKDQHRLLTPGQINIAASEGSLVVARMLPNREGLSVPQIAELVQEFGYSTHVIDLDKPTQIAEEESAINSIPKDLKNRSKIHSYIESSIPVILVLAKNNQQYQHAVVVIGHGELIPETPLVDNIAISKFPVNSCAFENMVTIYNSALWANSFIVQDDSRGPYIELPFEARQSSFSFCDAKYAIPLLPVDVFMTAEEAEVASIRLFRSLTPINKEAKFTIRVYLCERHEFRRWATEEENLSNKVKKHYRQHILPRRVWIAEISHIEDYGTNNGKNSTRFGEIILDASADHYEAPFLLAHFNLSKFSENRTDGILYTRLVDPDAKTEHMRIEFIEDEKQYKPMLRGAEGTA